MVLGLILAVGFVPSAKSLLDFAWSSFGGPLASWKWLAEGLSFPLLAGLFYITLPKPRKSNGLVPLGQVMEISLLPLLVALAFGYFHPYPSLFSQFQGGTLFIPETLQSLLWYLLFVPIGEELLFRGWIYGIFERLFPNHRLSATNPLPPSVWMSTIAFSIWHLQNLSQDSIPWVCFQLLYTLLTGGWLGYLRYKTGKIWFSLCAHIGINVLSNLL